MPDESEDEVKTKIRIFYGLRKDINLYTNPSGNGWVGQPGGQKGDYMTLKNARRQIFGLCVGSSDLIGWITINGIAVFIAFEVKTRTGRATADQLNFIEKVKSMGGIAGIVRSVADCEQLIAEYKEKHAA